MPTPHRYRSVIVWGLLTLSLGLVLSAFAAWQQAQTNQRLAQQAFDALTERVVGEVVQSFRRYEHGLRGARGAVVAVGEQALSQSLFSRYVESRDIDKEFPGARGFGFIKRVPAEDEAAFVAGVRASGQPDFTVRQLAPHGGERFIIQYIEPLQRNAQAVGLDIASEANRREAALTALRQGTATLTGPITLVQASGMPQRSFLLLLPTNIKPALGGTVTANDTRKGPAADGWAYAPLVIDEVLAGLNVHAEQFSLSLADVTSAPAAEAFFTAGQPDGPEPATGLSTEVVQQLFGRNWKMTLQARPAFLAQLVQLHPATVGGLGAGITFLLATLQSLLLMARVRREETLAERARTATIVDNSNDAIIGQALDGRVTSWNRAAERLFGYTEDQALHQAVAQLLLSPERAHEDSALLQRAASRQLIEAFDAERLHRDGTVVQVSITAGPILDASGQVIGIAQLMRNVAERKSLERRLVELNTDLDHRVHERTQALEVAQRDLRTVLDAMPSMIGYWDRQLINRVANRAYEEWFGLAPKQLPGMGLRDLLGSTRFEATRGFVESALRGEPQTFEGAMQRPDGQGIRHSLTKYIPDLREGEVAGFYVIAHDVTELTESRERLEATTRENEALMRTIDSHSLYSVADVQGNITDVNEGFCRISGYTREELLGQNHRILNSGTHGSDFWRDMWRTIASGQPWRQEVCNRAKDGSLYWVDSVIAPVLGAGGRVQKYISIRHDVTARKTIENSLREGEAFLDQVGTVSGMGGWQYDGATRQMEWSRQTRRIVGVNDDFQPSLGSTLAMYPQDARPRITRAIEAALEQGQAFDLELPLVTVNGAARWVRVVGEAVQDASRPGGTPHRLVGALQDVTERHESATALREAKRSAEAASAAKGAFLANMSHEIRTPLNAVLGVTHLLADSGLDAYQRNLLNKAQLAGRALLGIVNDVLDLAKIEAGETTLDEADYQPAMLAVEIESVYGQQARSKGLAFSFDMAPDVPPWLHGDSNLLRQALTNLVANAVKFTSQGSVELQWAVKDVGEDRCTLIVRVRDTGIGIAPEIQPRLFSPFVQADASTTRQFGGTGLGLSIVHRLAQLMGGEVGLNSAEGQGSEFWVAVPQSIPKEAKALQAMTSQAALEVLIVDDNPIDRMGLAALARALGWRATACDSAQELELIMENHLADGTTLPDALLVDWQMPGMDGLQALHKLSARLGRAHLPASLILSAHDRNEISAQDTEHLAEHILSKPVNASTLFNAVNDCLARRHGDADRMLQTPRDAAVDALGLAGIHILLVDDSDINLEVARRLLERRGARVQTSMNGLEALALLRQTEQPFDVVLMDVQMPRMDGLEATRRIRSELGLTGLPIIAMTAGALMEERRRALQAGMNEFMTKPLDPTLMVKTVRRVVQAARGVVLPELRPAPVEQTQATRWPQVEGINARDVSNRLGRDVELFMDMLGRLAREHADLALPEVAELPSAPEARHALALRVHKLRGSAGILGAQELHRLATAAEATLRDDADPQAATAALLSMSQALDRLLKAATKALLQPATRRSASTSAQTDAAAPVTPVAAAALATPEALRELTDLLQRQDIEALDRFAELLPALQSLLGEQRAQALQKALQDLDFTRGLDLLR